ncbi:hypothetical protein JI749_13495 [Devosia oryziradicis]|uniref:GlsB/YeaQ/YmgE family stress response membrane protein n=1 Tax=Devosia oryziradicis TaxID=2801335 RepID=A0ABX7BTS3_9HYPH|nr:hypothetical protein [Devosia oryziradicis]QQR35360.1 hypothetical protein JI749_13495 [Devosia oryziradicis]
MSATTVSTSAIPHYAFWTAAAVPTLILTGFGLVTTLPIAILGIAALRDPRLAPVRAWIGLTVGMLVGPFFTWLFRADPSASLTSLLHPAMAIAIAAGAGVTLIAMLRQNRG